jgi:hypothetical protein
MSRPAAFILLGHFGLLGRHALYIDDLIRRGLSVLMIAPSAGSESAHIHRRDPHHPASLLADVEFVDGTLTADGSFNAAAVAAAMVWRESYAIVGVHTLGEILVEPSGFIADALGIRSPGLRATRVCRSKYLQRWYLPEWSPEAQILPPGERGHGSRMSPQFPVVVKPAGRHSSSGVFSVADADALNEQLTTYPSEEVLLIEEKVIGPEYSVESLVQNGWVIFASITQKRTNEFSTDGFVELAHTVGDAANHAHPGILQVNEAVIAALNFEDGATNAEYRETEDGSVYLMEIAARQAGDGTLHLYHLACGRPMEPAIIEIAMGEEAAYPPPQRFARQVYLDHEHGVLEDVIVDWPGVEPCWVGPAGLWPTMIPGSPNDPPALRAVLVLKPRGALLGALKESADRAVTFFIDAPTVEELDALEERVLDAISLQLGPTPLVA